MWQFFLVAALAGFFSNRLRAAKACHSSAGKRIEKCDRRYREETRVDSVESRVSSPTASLCPLVRIDDYVPKEEDFFRFSSPESGSGDGSRLVATNLGKKEQRKGSRRFGLRLKRRRIGMNSAANKHGSCPSKGDCSFGWGIGLGMMYMMMSTRKSEISKLNSAMDEASKSIKEFKAELNKRRSSSSRRITTSKCDSELNKEHNDIKFSSFPTVDDGDYPSSVLTEEHDPELIEIDQLEAEFVLELQKLPCCSAEASQPDGMSPNLPAFDLVKDAETETKLHYSDPYHFHGVNPSELEQKLSRLLIDQQENQIMELEFKLETTRFKLNAKEAELRALKDRLRRLTELSLSTVTDDETEAHEGSVRCTDNLDYNNR